MRFSVILPVFNGHEVLSQCLNSILRQGYSDMEVIIADDGSDDGSMETVIRYKEEYPSIVVLNSNHRGISGARNVALLKAKGDYVLFVNPEDRLERDAFTKLDRALENNPDILIGKFFEEDLYGISEVDSLFNEYVKNGFNQERAIDWILKESEYPWSVQNKVVKTSFIRRYSFRFLEGYEHENIDWVARLCYFAKEFGYMEDAWIICPKPASVSDNRQITYKEMKDMIRIASVHYSLYKNNPSKLRNSIFMKIMESFYETLFLVYQLKEEEKKDIEESLKENSELLNVKPDLKYALFASTMKSFGVESALKALSMIKKDK